MSVKASVSYYLLSWAEIYAKLALERRKLFPYNDRIMSALLSELSPPDFLEP